MKVGLGSYALDWSIGVPGLEPRDPMDAAAVLDFARSEEISVVQIADNLPLHTSSPEERAKLKNKADQSGIAVEVGIRGIQPENLARYIPIAGEFGSPILRAVIDAQDFHPSIPEIVEIIRDAAPLLERHGAVLALENHDRFKAREFVRIIRESGGGTPREAPVGICLDTVNSFGALEGPDVVIETLIDYVVSLHVKDFTIYRPSHNMGFILEGTPAGEGMLDIPGIIGMLGERDIDCNAVLELWPTPEATPDETAAKEKEWARSSLRYLKNLIE
ncbi:MAG: sugar phosphate isomerase/epimerase family protein [Spirochaetia bacterium]